MFQCATLKKILLLQNEVEVRKLDIYDEHLVNGSFCVTKCQIPNSAGNYCTDVCVESDLYCNGNIDMPALNNSLSIFVKHSTVLSINYTISDALLYPDELYCSSRLHAIFMIAYVLTFVSFSFSVALIVRTRPLLHFLIRRRAKEVRKKTEMFNNSA